jgi:predicted RNA binding protein YcfA (HicA-like mRNA interferase family)
MKSYTPKEIISILITNGSELARVDGSHHIYINRANGKRTVIPVHAKDLKRGHCTEYLNRQGLN